MEKGRFHSRFTSPDKQGSGLNPVWFMMLRQHFITLLLLLLPNSQLSALWCWITNLWGRQWISPTVESRLCETVPAGVARLPFGHQRLCTLDNVPQAVDEALFLWWQDELIVHLEAKVTSPNLLKWEHFEFLVVNAQHREHSRKETAVPEHCISKR